MVQALPPKADALSIIEVRMRDAAHFAREVQRFASVMVGGKASQFVVAYPATDEDADMPDGRLEEIGAVAIDLESELAFGRAALRAMQAAMLPADDGISLASDVRPVIKPRRRAL